MIKWELRPSGRDPTEVVGQRPLQQRLGGAAGDAHGTEVRDVEHDRVATQDIFLFDRTGVTDTGKVQGRFRWSGVRPKILERFRMAGVQFDETLFNETLDVNL